ncbi:SRPBCC family protein, partial [bacterium]|nr:SRPBCC family protein [bacterium]
MQTGAAIGRPRFAFLVPPKVWLARNRPDLAVLVRPRPKMLGPCRDLELRQARTTFSAAQGTASRRHKEGTAMEIDRRAPVVESQTIAIPLPPREVWAVLTDLDSWPRWNPGVTRMERRGPVAP